MKFGAVAVAEAEGAILAHSVSSPAMKKGRRLSAADIAALIAAGQNEVIVARIEPGDVLEDEAARRVAAAIAGDGARVAAPFTGRANLYAKTRGLVTLDRAAIARINAIDEGISIATLGPFERVECGQMIATVKIIPFAVSEHNVATAEAEAGRSKLSVTAMIPYRAGLVLTTLPGIKPTVLAKRQRAIADRLASLGSRVAETVTVPHTIEAVAAALDQLRITGCAPLLVFAASAIIDRADVIPAALEAAGGTIERLGMPVDPGNLLLLGSLRDVRVVGIPSCAASPKLNGFDWVLERLLAGLPVTSEDIATMGVGGLLKEIVSRPQPRDGESVIAAPVARQAPRIAVLVLAGGRSTRMGSNKLLEPLGGKPIVRHVVEAARASSAAEVIVVTGNVAGSIRRALSGLDVRFVDNPHFADGISTSLKTGLAALDPAIDAVLVTLGDMPEVSAQHIDRLIAAFSPADHRTIVVPTRHGKRGNPTLWARTYFADMATASGDTGAKHLIGQYANEVVEVDLESDAVLADVDTPDALAALRARFVQPG